MILFMDDCPERAALAHQWMTPERRDRTMWCMTAAEAISVIGDEAYRKELETVHLDHDLGGKRFQDPTEENCGMEVVRFIETLDPETLKHIRFNIHTHNPPAGKEMTVRLLKLGLKAAYNPFGRKEVL